MKYVVDSQDRIATLAAEVDRRLGLPWFPGGVCPADGQDPSTVEGVSLHYTELIRNPIDSAVAAYPVDDTTGPILSKILGGNFDPAELSDDWLAPNLDSVIKRL